MTHTNYWSRLYRTLVEYFILEPAPVPRFPYTPHITVYFKHHTLRKDMSAFLMKIMIYTTYGVIIEKHHAQNKW